MPSKNFIHKVFRDRIEKTLFQETTDSVSLIRIPPPSPPSSGRKSDPLQTVDSSNWNFTDDTDVLWSGNVRFTEIEKIDPHGSNINDHYESIQGLLQLVNVPNARESLSTDKESIFAEFWYNLQLDTVKPTSHVRYFRILIESKDKRVALGLRFDNLDSANNFILALRHFKKDVSILKVSHEKGMLDQYHNYHCDYHNRPDTQFNISHDVEGLKIEGTPELRHPSVSN